MPDAGEIKAKVTIEYDGEGLKKAKEDLASLSEAAGSFGELASGAGDGLAQLDEHAQSLASSMGDLASPMEEGRRAIWQLVEGGAPGQQMLMGMSDAVEALQTPLEDTTRLLEAAVPPMAQLAEHAQSMVTQIAPVSDGFVQIGEAMGGMNEHAQGLASSMSDLAPQIESGQRAIWQLVEGGAPGQQMLIGMGEAAESLGESLSATVPMLPQFADSLHALEESAAPTGQTLIASAKSWREFTDVFSGAADTTAQNIQVLSGALEDPAPFQMIQDHLNETGQTWEDFSSSIGKNNAATLGEMRANSDETHQALGTMSTSFDDVQSSTEGANKAVRDFFGIGADESVVNGFVVKAGDLEGPMEHLASLKPIGMGEAFSGTVGSIMEGMNQLMMPLMAVQMIGMAVGAVGQGIYDMAGLAEGPAAHSMGSFTGAVDALGQSAQQSAEQFSESFGRQVIPTLDAMNYQMNQANGSGGTGGFGGGTGAAVSFLFNLAQIGTGINPIGGVEGLINQGASAFGMSEPFQGPPPAQQAQINYQRQLASMPQTVQGQTYQAQLQSATLLADVTNPGYLQAQDNLGASQQIAQRLQQSYNISHPVNQAQLLQDAQYQQYAQKEGPLLADAQANAPNYLQSIGQNISQGNWGAAGNDLLSGTFLGPIGDFLNSMHGGGSGPRSSAMNGMFPGFDSGIGGIFGGLGQDWNNLFGGGRIPETMPSAGCFPAGTRVLMSDGIEKAIETLQVGDAVLGSDGAKQVSTSIRALILPPPKHVYELVFSDGNTLTLTDAHPISTTHGWKSIEPKATAKENPELKVSRLMWGDVIHTANGTCQLVEITPLQGKTQVYNITVGNPHTFYANGVLVHNKLQSQVGQQAADQIGGIQLPHIDLSGMASTLSGDFSSIQLPHMDLSGMASGVGSAFSGISLPHLDLSGMASGIGSAFSGISLPHIDLSSISSSLSGAFSGISLPSIPNIGAQISSAVSGMFSGISLPSIPNIGAQVSGALSGMFGGISLPSIPNIGAMVSGAMSGMFGGISLPSIPDMGAMLSGAMSGMFGGISLPSIPDLGAMISGAMSGMFGGVSMPSVPAFASGVQGFAGGGAIIGEAGVEVAEYNGHYSLFDQGATFVNLPAGASVYPIQDMSTHGSPWMLAQGTGGGGFSPLSLGGGSTPQSINLSVHFDSQVILSAIGLPLSQNIRVQSGMRGY